MAADSRIIGSRSAPILSWNDYRKYRMAAIRTVESNIIPERIAENSLPVLIDAMKSGDSCHASIPPMLHIQCAATPFCALSGEDGNTYYLTGSDSSTASPTSDNNRQFAHL